MRQPSCISWLRDCISEKLPFSSGIVFLTIISLASCSVNGNYGLGGGESAAPDLKGETRHLPFSEMVTVFLRKDINSICAKKQPAAIVENIQTTKYDPSIAWYSIKGLQGCVTGGEDYEWLEFSVAPVAGIEHKVVAQGDGKMANTAAAPRDDWYVEPIGDAALNEFFYRMTQRLQNFSGESLQ